MKQSQFYYLLRRGLFSAGSAIIKNGLVMFNKFTTAGISHPAQGSALFNGTSDFIQLNESFSHTNHTIAAWVYVNDTAYNKEIFDNRNVSSNGILLYATNDEKIYYRLDSGANLDSVNTQVNKWVFAVGTYDGTTQKLYIDGSLERSQNISVTINTAQDAIIGRYTISDANPFDGNLANVAIWNRALSSDEINSVMWKSYEGLTDSEENGLQAWYSLDDITSPAASLANMEQLATDKDATIENKAAITAAINALS